MKTSYVILAKLDILHAKVMGAKNRKSIAIWLRQQAKDVEADGENYSPKYSAVYHAPKS